MRAGFDCKVTAAFLESGRTLANVANAAAVIAALSWWTRSSAGNLLGLSLAAWLVEIWFAVRVAIDRALFNTLAQEPADGADWLDALLVDWKLLKTPQSPSMRQRSMSDRSRGALRLWKMQALAVVLQLSLLGAALILRAVYY